MLRKRYAGILLALALIGGIGAIIHGQIQKHILKDLPIKYVYDPYDTATSYVFYISDLQYKKQYFRFVNDDMSYTEKIKIDFPFENFLAKGERIYVRGYSSDSSLIEFYNAKHNNKFFNYTTGYIHRNFVHDTENENLK